MSEPDATPVYRVVVYRNDEVIFQGTPRQNDAEDFLTVSRLGGQPARLECSVPDLSATQAKDRPTERTP